MTLHWSSNTTDYCATSLKPTTRVLIHSKTESGNEQGYGVSSYLWRSGLSRFLHNIADFKWWSKFEMNQTPITSPLTGNNHINTNLTKSNICLVVDTHIWMFENASKRDLLDIVVQPLDLHLVNVGSIPTGPTHGEGRLQPHPEDVLKSTPNVRKSPRSGLNLEGKLSDPQFFLDR